MQKRSQKMFFGFLVMVTLTLQGCGFSPNVDNDTEKNTTNVTTSANVQNSPVTPMSSGMGATNTTMMNTGKSTNMMSPSINGTFHLSQVYNSPAGPETMDATVTIKNNIITAVDAKNVAIAEQSKRYQDRFVGGIAGQVVGKNINDVQVTYVNGSSLTARAFNIALHALEK